MKKILLISLAMLLFLSGCTPATNDNSEIRFKSRFNHENTINLSDEKIEFNGKVLGESGDVFLSHDIIYYQEKDTYESGNPYGEGSSEDMHTEDEASAHSVINITKSGAYRISGVLSAGQIRVDLGENANKNPDAVVELILDNADITCSVAPAILFMNVYECDNDWTVDDATYEVDTTNSGAVLVLADGSTNDVNGSYVAKIFKDKDGEEKLWKQDGAIYSYMSMNVFGGGTLNLFAENEGLDTELHLTINSGNINISSDNDGINTNEDGVSVTTINGGKLNILAGLGTEGDGIDSNGWLVINGGYVTSSANPIADAGLDSDLGSFVNGGVVVSTGSTMDWPESDSNQVTINLQFKDSQKADSKIVVKNSDGKAVFEYKAEKNSLTEGKMRDFRGAIISSPEFKLNDEYTVFVDEVKQGYVETDFKGGPDGFHGTKPKDTPDFPDGERPEPTDGKRPEHPNGKPFEMPEGKDFAPPEDDMPPLSFENEEDNNKEQKDIFFMADKVNRFSSVAGLLKK